MDDNERLRIKQFSEIITTLKPNVVTLAELSHFAPMFIKPAPDATIDYDRIQELSNEFMQRFDAYRPVDVVDSNKKVLFQIPQLFLPISNIKKEYMGLLDSFRAEGSSDIPKYAAEATNGMVAALFKSQSDDAKEQGYVSFSDFVKKKTVEFRTSIVKFKDFQASRPTVEATKAKQVDVVKEEDGFVWE